MADGMWRTVALALIAGPIAVAIVFRRPVLIAKSIMIVLGAAPFSAVPLLGFQIQLILCLTVIYWISVAMGLIPKPASGEVWKPGLIAVFALLFASFLAYIATRGRFGLSDDIEFWKWAIAVSLVLVLVRHTAQEIRKLARTFVVATAAGAIFALASIVPGGSSLLNLLGAIGYQRNADDSQAYFLQNGERVAARLSGSFVDPNIAAMFFFVAVVIAFVLFKGHGRFWLVCVLLVALVATLSRGGMLALASTLIIFVVFNRKNLGRRAGVLVASGGLTALVFAIPVTRQRLLTSFGQQDVGSVDRLEALDQFSSIMTNDWLWGLGWGRPEFRNAAVSYAVNMVANAPLASVYRAGLVAGIGFLIVLLISVWAAMMLIRMGSWRSVAVGGMVLGFIGALQTGYGVITITPMTALMSVLLLVVLRMDAFLDAPGKDQTRLGPDLETQATELSSFQQHARLKTARSAPTRSGVM